VCGKRTWRLGMGKGENWVSGIGEGRELSKRLRQ
jgi:hypothetical protein